MGEVGDEFNELLESFKSLCLNQRLFDLNSKSSSTDINGQTFIQMESELKASSQTLAIKLFTKAGDLERLGEYGKGTPQHCVHFKVNVNNGKI